MDIEGEITSRGTGAIDTPAPADSEVVRRLRAAGAIIVGKTKMPELGLWPFTESITWGVTRNPWDTDRTPGGSSGGSAAAVAAGLVPAAVAADGAGSIRIPAACCGLFGLKPHSGRVPRAPHDADGSHWICFGAVTRSVEDSALLLDVMAPGIVKPQRRPLRIAYSERFPPGVMGKLAPEMLSALRDSAELLRNLGHEVGRSRPGLPRPRRAADPRPAVPRHPRHRGRDREAAAARAAHPRDRPARGARARAGGGADAARGAAARRARRRASGTTTTCC